MFVMELLYNNNNEWIVYIYIYINIYIFMLLNIYRD